MDSPKKKFSFETRISLLLMLVFILVLITAIFTYRGLNSIVNSVDRELRPDARLLIMKEILNNLADAENSAKSFSLTQNEEYLTEFYLTINRTDEFFAELDSITEGYDKEHGSIEFLDSLVSEKFDVLNELLYLQDNSRTQEALKQVSEQLEQAAVPDSLRERKKEEKVGFFRRIFGKRKDREPDSLATDTSSVEMIGLRVDEIRQKERQLEKQIRARELALINKDKAITDRIRGLIGRMEEREQAAMEEQIARARQEARNTNLMIVGFCIIAGLLLFSAIFVIAGYVSTNRKYRAALQDAREKAETLARTKERFLANMSHEIRTPMNAIAGFTREVLKTPLSSEQKENLLIVQRSSEHLLGILNDVLDFSKLEAGKMQPEKKPFSPAEMAEEVVLMGRSLLEGKKINLNARIAPGIPEKLSGDPARVRQILINLVSNAVKFTDRGEIRLKVEKGDQKDQTVYLHFLVADTGIGIEPSDLDRVFNEFEQARNQADAHIRGTGLGLSITKKLVELLGGRIKASSEPGLGTTIDVVLPFTLPEYAGPGKKAGNTDRIHLSLEGNPRILIVDDEPYNRQLIAKILKSYGAICEEASNGKQALEKTVTGDFDLALMDIRMPEMSGTEATESIRKLKDPAKSRTPVIALTAAVSKEDEERYSEAGMDAMVAKPFHEEELIRKINDLLEQPGMEKAMNENGSTDESPHYDVEELKKMSGGDDAFFRDMLSKFVVNTGKGIEEMKELARKGKLTKLEDMAHRLAAPCRHLDAKELYGILKKIESLSAANQNKEEIENLLVKAERTAGELFFDIRQRFLNGKSAGKSGKG